MDGQGRAGGGKSGPGSTPGGRRAHDGQELLVLVEGRAAGSGGRAAEERQEEEVAEERLQVERRQGLAVEVERRQVERRQGLALEVERRQVVQERLRVERRHGLEVERRQLGGGPCHGLEDGHERLSGSHQGRGCRSRCHQGPGCLARRGFPSAPSTTGATSCVPASSWCLCKGTHPRTSACLASSPASKEGKCSRHSCSECQSESKRHSGAYTWRFSPEDFPIGICNMGTTSCREICCSSPHGDTFRRCSHTRRTRGSRRSPC